LSGEKPEIIALIPAAGRGTRLGQIPCSKELLPLIPTVGNPYAPWPGSRVAIEDTLYMLAENGVLSAVIVVAPEKTDIQPYLENFPCPDIDVRFVERASSPSVPHTLAAALADISGTEFALVFPDIVFSPRDTLRRLALQHATNGADITLALVPSDRGDKVDMVTTSPAGDVLDILPKPGAGRRGLTWIAALWNARFSAYLADFVARQKEVTAGEIHVSDVFNAARTDGLAVRALTIMDGKALDIGTPEDLEALWRLGFDDYRR
jgi:glucose-1-phosphate thymidylyltransferase